MDEIAHVWIVEAEHPWVPGRSILIFSNEAAARLEALDLLNLIIKDWNTTHGDDDDVLEPATLETYDANFALLEERLVEASLNDDWFLDVYQRPLRAHARMGELKGGLMTKRITVVIEYEDDPSFRQTATQRRRTILRRALERLETERGQQVGVNVSAITIDGDRQEF